MPFWGRSNDELLSSQAERVAIVSSDIVGNVISIEVRTGYGRIVFADTIGSISRINRLPRKKNLEIKAQNPNN